MDCHALVYESFIRDGAPCSQNREGSPRIIADPRSSSYLRQNVGYGAHHLCFPLDHRIEEKDRVFHHCAFFDDYSGEEDRPDHFSSYGATGIEERVLNGG